MAPRPRPLWQLLLNITDPASPQAMSCDECFTLLEYYAETAVTGADPQSALRQARALVDRCAPCRKYLLRRLHEMEASLMQGTMVS